LGGREVGDVPRTDGRGTKGITREREKESLTVRNLKKTRRSARGCGIKDGPASKRSAPVAVGGGPWRKMRGKRHFAGGLAIKRQKAF